MADFSVSAPPLGEAEVFEVCRALYDASAEDFILPPLLRSAERLSRVSGRTYVVEEKFKRIRFCIEFDRDFVETSKFPLAKIPITFSGRVFYLEIGGLERELYDNELYAFISAFILGAKAPIIVEKYSVFPYYKITLQLSSTFFVECGEMLDQGADLRADMVCDRVSMSLYNKSKHFFQNSHQGLAVWSARAAQELFGAPRPSAEALWPIAEPQSETATDE